jgi:hypothetical protein
MEAADQLIRIKSCANKNMPPAIVCQHFFLINLPAASICVTPQLFASQHHLGHVEVKSVASQIPAVLLSQVIGTAIRN